MPIPPVEAQTELVRRGRAADRRRVPAAHRRGRGGEPARRGGRRRARPDHGARRPRRLAPRLRRSRTASAREFLRFDCFDEDPHYHYVSWRATRERDAAPRSGRRRRPARLGARAASARACRRCSSAPAPRDVAARVDCARARATRCRASPRPPSARATSTTTRRCSRPRVAGWSAGAEGRRARHRRRAAARAPRPPGRRRRRPRDRDGARLPAVLRRLRPKDRGGGDLAEALRARSAASTSTRWCCARGAGSREDERRASLGRRGRRGGRCPPANTLDRATAHLPRLLHERLDDLGIDFAVLYPSRTLTTTAIQRRRGAPGRVPRAQRLQRRGLRALRRPHDAGRADPDAHAAPRRSPSSSTRSASSASRRS